MTFKERCKRFERNSQKENNIFKYIARLIFLNKKIDEHNEEIKMFELEEKIANRPKGSYWKNR